ncbi:bZIP transcription factor [Blastococcus sp. SYSU DS0510]
MVAQRRTRAGRRGGAAGGPGRRAALVLALALEGLAACGAGATSPALEAEVQGLREEVDELRDRVEALEQQPPPSAAPSGAPPTEDPSASGDEEPATDGGAEQPFDDPAGLFQDPEPLVGQDVTVTAEVVQLVSVADVGAAFRLGDGDGTTVGVVTVTPPGDLELGDVLRVTGPVGRVQRDSFEADFGISADVLAEDPETLFAELGGEIAVAAREVRVVRQSSG